jgi:hypothetical protein
MEIISVEVEVETVSTHSVETDGEHKKIDEKISLILYGFYIYFY